MTDPGKYKDVYSYENISLNESIFSPEQLKNIEAVFDDYFTLRVQEIVSGHEIDDVLEDFYTMVRAWTLPVSPLHRPYTHLTSILDRIDSLFADTRIDFELLYMDIRMELNSGTVKERQYVVSDDHRWRSISISTSTREKYDTYIDDYTNDLDTPIVLEDIQDAISSKKMWLLMTYSRYSPDYFYEDEVMDFMFSVFTNDQMLDFIYNTIPASQWAQGLFERHYKKFDFLTKEQTTRVFLLIAWSVFGDCFGDRGFFDRMYTKLWKDNTVLYTIVSEQMSAHRYKSLLGVDLWREEMSKPQQDALITTRKDTLTLRSMLSIQEFWWKSISDILWIHVYKDLIHTAHTKELQKLNTMIASIKKRYWVTVTWNPHNSEKNLKNIDMNEKLTLLKLSQYMSHLYSELYYYPPPFLHRKKIILTEDIPSEENENIWGFVNSTFPDIIYLDISDENVFHHELAHSRDMDHKSLEEDNYYSNFLVAKFVWKEWKKYSYIPSNSWDLLLPYSVPSSYALSSADENQAELSQLIYEWWLPDALSLMGTWFVNLLDVFDGALPEIVYPSGLLDTNKKKIHTKLSWMKTQELVAMCKKIRWDDIYATFIADIDDKFASGVYSYFDAYEGAQVSYTDKDKYMHKTLVSLLFVENVAYLMQLKSIEAHVWCHLGYIWWVDQKIWFTNCMTDQYREKHSIPRDFLWVWLHEYVDQDEIVHYQNALLYDTFNGWKKSKDESWEDSGRREVMYYDESYNL